jgi:hypothetical protein
MSGLSTEEDLVPQGVSYRDGKFTNSDPGTGQQKKLIANIL